jgi:hypothetical protein
MPTESKPPVPWLLIVMIAVACGFMISTLFTEWSR